MHKICDFKSYALYTRNSPYYVVPVLPLLLLLLIDQLFPYYKVERDGFVETTVHARQLIYAVVLFILMLFFSSSGLPFIYFQF